ncbi:MAG: Holliday junction branch migration protein RuvA [Chloroflexi bacterium]|nr:Holliday junction branch migration protein RuvA [Chloroflexota bacterium]
MIASLYGTVDVIGHDALVLDVGGVGYRVFAGPSTLASARLGEALKLHTHHLVREDLQALYGFRTAEEVALFTLLLSVTGVGPKVALAILSSRPVADLQLAVMQGDEAVLTSVSGVGKRLAARIVLELREKVAAAGMAAAAAVPGRGSSAGAGETEVVAALQALGYSQSEAREAARGSVADAGSDASLEERVKSALRRLSRE